MTSCSLARIFTKTKTLFLFYQPHGLRIKHNAWGWGSPFIVKSEIMAQMGFQIVEVRGGQEMTAGPCLFLWLTSDAKTQSYWADASLVPVREMSSFAWVLYSKTKNGNIGIAKSIYVNKYIVRTLWASETIVSCQHRQHFKVVYLILTRF